MITAKHIMTYWQYIMECAGEEEKKDHSHERYNDNAVIFFYCQSYCVHINLLEFGTWLDKFVTYKIQTILVRRHHQTW